MSSGPIAVPAKGIALADAPSAYMTPAKTCSYFVNVAVDMCKQWLKKKRPSPQDFKWTPCNECSFVTGPDLSSVKISPLLWSTFTWKNSSYTEPFGFVAVDGSTAYLIYRGSQTDADFGMDAETALTPYSPPYGSAPGAEVETGFYTVFNGIPNLQSVLRSMMSGVKTLYISGHSLGSAVATLSVPAAAAVGLSSGLQCNQASPKVGDAKFAQYIDGLPIKTYRLVNTYDAVPKAPFNPKYVHAGTEVYFGADYQTEPQKHNPCCSYSYALANPTNPVNPDIQSCVKTVPLTPEGNLP